MPGMAGRLGHPPDLPEHIFLSDLSRLFYAFSPCQFCERRPTCHGRNATFGAKAYVPNSVSIQFQTEFQNIAAYGIFHPHLGVRVFYFARVARILKMIKQFGGIHGLIVNVL